MGECDLAGRSAEIDALVLARFPERAGLALLAVGGYGRRELFPYSDVDLLILAESEDRIQATRNDVAAFLRGLWDAGLRVSQSTRVPADCLALPDGNAELTVSLLDRRLAAGDADTYRRFEPRYQAFFERRKEGIAGELARLTRERHLQFQNTIFHLEPNVKDGPGGLRDVQVVQWLARLAPGQADLAGAGAVLTGLRCELHRFFGRDKNVLTFEAQDRIAERRGVSTARAMADFYHAARRVQRAVSRALDARDTQRSPLFSPMRERWSRISNAEFSIGNGLVYLRAPLDARRVLRLFTFVARNGCRLAPEAGRRVHDERALLREAPGIWPEWKEILVLPHAGLALREMHESELLTVIFPELAAIECLVVRDFYHLYTVDEHTLVAIEEALALRTAERSAFSELARDTEDGGVLALALLFHDVGKGGGAESHAAASARVAGPALERIGVPEWDRETILFLIEAHLEMSAMMHARDLSDPATARAMADRVGTVERLKLLTLMTWADVSAVNPAAMTAWRESLLWQLYLVTYRELTHELQTDKIATGAGGSAERRAFLEGLPVRYLRTHSEAEIARHVRMERAGTSVELERREGMYRLTLVTRDRPFLFASAAGAISSFGMDIVKAEAFGNARGAVIDIFTFADPIRTLELNPTEEERLREVVESAALGRVDVNELLARRVRRGVAGGAVAGRPATVTIDEGSVEAATLIEIVAEDRPRLLYDLASAISREECSIQVVLINTEAHKAVDVFYVTYEGGKVPAERSARLAVALGAGNG